MKCVICKHGTTHPSTCTFALERSDLVIAYKNVPAQVCDNCGEAYLDANVSRDLLAAAEQQLAQKSIELNDFRFALAA